MNKRESGTVLKNKYFKTPMTLMDKTFGGSYKYFEGKKREI